MLSSTGRAFMEQAPWLAIFPGLAISLAVLAFNLFGDTLRDAWDPKLRSRASARAPMTAHPLSATALPGRGAWGDCGGLLGAPHYLDKTRMPHL